MLLPRGVSSACRTNWYSSRVTRASQPEPIKYQYGTSHDADWPLIWTLSANEAWGSRQLLRRQVYIIKPAYRKQDILEDRDIRTDPPERTTPVYFGLLQPCRHPFVMVRSHRPPSCPAERPRWPLRPAAVSPCSLWPAVSVRAPRPSATLPECRQTGAVICGAHLCHGTVEMVRMAACCSPWAAMANKMKCAHSRAGKRTQERSSPVAVPFWGFM